MAMLDPLRIEPMTPEDVHAAAAIEGPTRLDETHLRDEMARAWSRMWVARRGADVVGFLAAWHVADELHVLNVATHSDQRRRGIGRALMQEAVTYARAHDVRHVLLEVRRSNRAAIALYRDRGFFAMGIRARYYPDGEDAVDMVLAFDPVTRDVSPHADEVTLED